MLAMEILCSIVDYFHLRHARPLPMIDNLISNPCPYQSATSQSLRDIGKTQSNILTNNIAEAAGTGNHP